MSMDLKALLSLIGTTKAKIQGYIHEQGLVFVKNKNIYNVHGQSFFDVDKLIVSFKFKGKTCSNIIIHQTYEDDDLAKLALIKLRSGLIETLGLPTSDNYKHQSNNLFVSWDKDINNYIQLNQTSDLKRIYIYISSKQTRIRNPKKMEWTISMIGGLFFGLAMYGLMGIAFGYNLLNFVIQMLGGLVWGLLFGFFMNRSVKKHPFDPYELKFTQRETDLFDTYVFGQTEIEGSQPCLCAFNTKMGLQFFKTHIYFYNHKAIFVYLRFRKLFEMTLPYANIDLYMAHEDTKEVVVWLNNKTKLIVRNNQGLQTLTQRLNAILGYEEQAYLNLEQMIFHTLLDYDLMGLMAGGASESIFKYDAKSIARYLYKERPLDSGDVEQVLLTYFEGLPIDSFETLANLIFDYYQNT